MWLTPFVYQYFIYNSLYQVDWEKSLASGIVAILLTPKGTSLFVWGMQVIVMAPL
jgi:hypothetical protein